MRILIDIGHPAHVHYFKNFIEIMESKGCQFLITSRNKEIEHYLLKKYNIPFFDRGKGEKSLIGKAIYYFKAVYFIYKKAKDYKPNVIISFGSPYLAIVSKLICKPHIVFNDTEHAKLSHFLTDPFSKWILTPSWYKKDLGKKQIRFKGYMELCYLHPDYFTPDPSVLDYLEVRKGEKYIIMRFVSWHASHDRGHSGLSLDMKRETVNELSKYARVFISSEGELPQDLKSYQIQIPPERMHDVLYYASMYFGEGGTMASESAVLGTVAINVATSAVHIGTFADIAKYGLMYVIRNEQEALKKAIELLEDCNLKAKALNKRKELLASKIDVTAFMTWFVESYPASANIMKTNPEYQYNFR